MKSTGSPVYASPYSNGMKLADEIEHEIEAEIFEHIDQLVDHKHDEGSLMAAILPGDACLRADYEYWLAASTASATAGAPHLPQLADVGSATSKLQKLRVLIDCANG